MEYLHQISFTMHFLFQNNILFRVSSQKSTRSLHNTSSGELVIPVVSFVSSGARNGIVQTTDPHSLA